MYATVDADRLWARQTATDLIGATANGGAHRMALTPEDIASHRLIADICLSRGWTLSIDDIGNLFAIRPGKSAALPPVASGSHTDSQPMAGRFDGMSGTLAGLEAMEAIDDAGIETQAALMLAVWNNEEGPRFNPACMGSAVYAGVRTLDELIDQTDADGISLRDCIADLRRAIPEAGRHEIGAPVGAFLESHIEQGIELETSGNVIGVVSGMQGYRRWHIDVTGEDGALRHHADQPAQGGVRRRDGHGGGAAPGLRRRDGRDALYHRPVRGSPRRHLGRAGHMCISPSTCATRPRTRCASRATGSRRSVATTLVRARSRSRSFNYLGDAGVSAGHP